MILQPLSLVTNLNSGLLSPSPQCQLQPCSHMGSEYPTARQELQPGAKHQLPGSPDAQPSVPACGPQPTALASSTAYCADDWQGHTSSLGFSPETWDIIEVWDARRKGWGDAKPVSSLWLTSPHTSVYRSRPSQQTLQLPFEVKGMPFLGQLLKEVVHVSEP